MQLLTFTIAAEWYAIDTRRVVEVIPLLPARPLPGAPDYVRGIVGHRGRLVPVIDLGARLAGVPARDRLGTRIILVAAGAGAAGPDAVRLGLVAEDVLSLHVPAAHEWQPRPLAVPDAPFLGDLLRVEGRTLHVLDVLRLVPAELLPAPAGAPSTIDTPEP